MWFHIASGQGREMPSYQITRKKKNQNMCQQPCWLSEGVGLSALPPTGGKKKNKAMRDFSESAL